MKVRYLTIFLFALIFCGFDMHLGLYRAKESAVASMDAAARKGICSG